MDSRFEISAMLPDVLETVERALFIANFTLLSKRSFLPYRNLLKGVCYFRRCEKPFFLLLKSIDKLSKNIFTKLQSPILSIFEDTKPKVEKRRAGADYYMNQE